MEEKKMKKFDCKVKMCDSYSTPVAPNVKGMKVGDVVKVWKSTRTDENGSLVCIELVNGNVIEMSRIFCNMHLEYM